MRQSNIKKIVAMAQRQAMAAADRERIAHCRAHNHDLLLRHDSSGAVTQNCEQGEENSG